MAPSKYSYPVINGKGNIKKKPVSNFRNIHTLRQKLSPSLGFSPPDDTDVNTYTLEVILQLLILGYRILECSDTSSDISQTEIATAIAYCEGLLEDDNTAAADRLAKRVKRDFEKWLQFLAARARAIEGPDQS